MVRANNAGISDSLLASLRGLVPSRPLAFYESLRIAEQQANYLLAHFAIAGPRVPNELVTDFPRVKVRYRADLPASGSAHWERGRWIITVNAGEPNGRQRFSLMHEFKHVIDHTTREYLYGDSNDHHAADLAERAADHFAACILMPKPWVEQAWLDSGHDVTRLAAHLEVSARAARVRLWHLNLGAPARRHRDRTRRSRPTSDTKYWRCRQLAGVIS